MGLEGGRDPALQGLVSVNLVKDMGTESRQRTPDPRDVVSTGRAEGWCSW